jgi:hypothetical protein
LACEGDRKGARRDKCGLTPEGQVNGTAYIMKVHDNRVSVSISSDNPVFVLSDGIYAIPILFIK